MNKTELVEAIAHETGQTKAATIIFVDSLINNITNALKNDGSVTIPGFMSMLVGNRAARQGRNPQTGQPIEIKASRVVKFKAGKALKDAVK